MTNTIGFLLRAKKATYAGKGAEVESSRPNSHDLKYTEGSLTYIDTYLDLLIKVKPFSEKNKNIFQSQN